jgi:hypothetical protein
MRGLEEEEFGRGFFLEGEVLPEQIADPSRADALDVIAWRHTPPATRREWEEASGGDLRNALTIDPHAVEWDIYMARCVPADEVGIVPHRVVER